MGFREMCSAHHTNTKEIQKKIQQNLFIFREMCSAHHTNTKEIQKKYKRDRKENSAKSFHLQGNVFGTPHKYKRNTKEIQKKIQQNLFIFREMCSAHHTNTKE